MAKKKTSHNGKDNLAASQALPSDTDDFLKGLKEQAGARVIGPVRLESRISKGGMGIVYRGRHVKLDIDVAVKFLLPNLANENPEYVVRFEREARMAAQLNNENLVRVFDVDSEKNYHYVVMEFVCGETARDRVARKGPLSESEAMEVVLGATRGLEAAHRKGIVHRDIKPENIMIDAAGIVKLADLGIAKMVGEGAPPEANITQPGFVMGTPSFMPPEQFHDSSSVGFSGDVYSMGATLYFLLAGKAPFSGNIYEIARRVSTEDFPDITRDRPGVSARIVELLRNATAKDPKARYPDAMALLRALEASGTGRLNLTDPDTGTVTAIAKVSTPPARRFGEIHVHVPPPKEGTPEPSGGDAQVSADPAAPHRPRHPPSRRGLIALGGIGLFAILFGVGLYPVIMSARQKSQERLDSRAAPPPPEVVVRQPEAPRPPPQVTTPDVKPEVVVKQTPPPRPASTDDPLPKDIVEKARASRDSLLAEKKRKESLLLRAEQLLAQNMLSETTNVLNTFEDWGDQRPRAARVRLRVVLAGGAANESAARKLLSVLCADPLSGGPGGACEEAHVEMYDYAGQPPPAGAGPSSYERKVELLRSLGLPSSELKKASEAAGKARTRLFSGYLTLLGDQADRALRGENVAGARQALERAEKFVRDEKAEDRVQEVSRLGTIRKSMEDLEGELKEWAALLPLNPGVSVLPEQLREDDLKSRIEKFNTFAQKYPASPRKGTASNYLARFQAILDSRRSVPRR